MVDAIQAVGIEPATQGASAAGGFFKRLRADFKTHEFSFVYCIRNP